MKKSLSDPAQSTKKGVYHQPATGRQPDRYHAVICAASQRYFLGEFVSEDDAAKAYDYAVCQLIPFRGTAERNFSEVIIDPPTDAVGTRVQKFSELLAGSTEGRLLVAKTARAAIEEILKNSFIARTLPPLDESRIKSFTSAYAAAIRGEDNWFNVAKSYIARGFDLL